MKNKEGGNLEVNGTSANSERMSHLGSSEANNLILSAMSGSLAMTSRGPNSEVYIQCGKRLLWQIPRGLLAYWACL